MLGGIKDNMSVEEFSLRSLKEEEGKEEEMTTL